MMQEKNRNILTKAITSLKDRKVKKSLWDNIIGALGESTEKGKEHLDRNLEAYKKKTMTAPDLWRDIQSNLNATEGNQAHLKRAIQELPEYNLPSEDFELIISSIDKGKESGKNTRFWISGIAASIIFILGIYYLSIVQHIPEEQITISYTEEQISGEMNAFELITQFSEQDEVLAFVEENCLQVALKCESPEFKGLLDQYLELDTTKQDLLKELAMHQEQVRLMDYLVRIEKEQTEVGKKLITLLLS
ncbi:hypothetical protein QQ008_08835 [Fulvivirgaceae bacterium BMA10]|uniref:Anti-sigma factor n=1 Tax=Splendidivirga corallicola TaxID=3051826 RepID=A0ABT8KPJ9_9BACT|nr:hypothetical protein [Fulvivirgaceae bacterium BMA10]